MPPPMLKPSRSDDLTRSASLAWTAMRPRLGWFAVLVCLSLAACSGPSASGGGFDSDNPAAKLYAIRRAGGAGDASAVPKLIEQLDSDDPAVRMLAIGALERLTGDRRGYNPYAPWPERRRAADAWAEAWRRGELPRATPDR